MCFTKVLDSDELENTHTQIKTKPNLALSPLIIEQSWGQAHVVRSAVIDGAQCLPSHSRAEDRIHGKMTTVASWAEIATEASDSSSWPVALAR